MSRNLLKFLAILPLFFIFLGCAGPIKPMTISEVGALSKVDDLGGLELQPNEAIVVVYLNYVGPNSGVLNFHYAGKEEASNPINLSPGDWFPMFSVSTLQRGRPLMYKIKA